MKIEVIAIFEKRDSDWKLIGVKDFKQIDSISTNLNYINNITLSSDVI